MDNGYNNPKADENVLKLVEELKVPLYRYVLDLKKFNQVYGAYLKAGVKNLEAVYDNLLAGASYEVASKYGIKWILSGGNVATESIMPESWSFKSGDLANMKNIYKKMTGKRLKRSNDFPLFGTLRFNFYKWISGIKVFYLLDYFDYNRENNKKMLMELYGYQDVGEKHEENELTKWYQNYYLYEKWNIDKRKAHYSSLINSGQMTRKEALEKLLDLPIYPLLGIEDRVMKYKKRSHYDFKVDKWYNRISKFVKLWRKLKFLGIKG